jgi:hypothetical protein
MNRLLSTKVSFFQMGWCQRITAQVHEMGHQLGFKHSGQGIYQYNDESCKLFDINVIILVAS